MVICLERGADLHMAELMPLPLTVSCFRKIQIGFTFLVPAHLGSPGQRAVKRVLLLLLLLFTYNDWNVLSLSDIQSHRPCHICTSVAVKGKGSPYSIAERRVLELIPVLGSQPARDVSHKPGGRLPLLSARPVVTLATLKRAATSLAA